MARIIKVRCNGPEHHVNEIDLDEVLKPFPVYRVMATGPGAANREIPERLVLPCQHGSEGKVVLTRDMILDFLARTGDSQEEAP